MYEYAQKNFEALAIMLHICRLLTEWSGRAGCTTKDFYHTNLKLKQLEFKKKTKKIKNQKV